MRRFADRGVVVVLVLSILFLSKIAVAEDYVWIDSGVHDVNETIGGYLIVSDATVNLLKDAHITVISGDGDLYCLENANVNIYGGAGDGIAYVVADANVTVFGNGFAVDGNELDPGATGVANGDPASPLDVQLSGTYVNGTAFRIHFNLDPGGAKVKLEWGELPPQQEIEWVYIDDPGVGGHEPFNGYMSKYETTNAQFAQYLNAALDSNEITVADSYVLGASGPYSGQNYYYLGGAGFNYNGATNGGAARINWTGNSFTVDAGFDEHPVTYVTWYGATAFASHYSWRLPTEWEWQAVADNRVEDPYEYGCGTSINNSIANYYGSAHLEGTAPVGSFGDPAGYGYGMCDMAGNVWEWTASDYSGSYRVRGGSWYVQDWRCTVSYRDGGNYPDYPGDNLGFRVCRDLPDMEIASEDINFAPVPGVPGSSVTIEATVWNNGQGGATGVVVDFKDFDEIIGSVTIPSIAGGDSGTASIRYTWTEAGSRLITVIVDPDNAIPESDEDNNGASTPYEIVIPNVPPIANDDMAVTNEDTAVTIEVLANDSDPDGLWEDLSIKSVALASHGDPVPNADNTITYTPGPNFNGYDSFTYTIKDGQGAMDSATVTVTVNAVEDAPDANAGSDQDVYAYILGNETTDVSLNGVGSYDPDGDSLTYTWFEGGIEIATGVSPTIELPLGNHIIELVVSDGILFASDEVEIRVHHDTPPVAEDIWVTTDEDTPVAVTLAATDANGDGLTYHIPTAPYTYKMGSISAGTAANRTYTPASNYYGSDRFTYKAYDGKLYSNEATVFITVNPVNDDPIAVNDITTVYKNSSSNAIYVLVNDRDPDYDLLTIESVTTPEHGSANNAGNFVEYTPQPDYLGPDSFEYTVSDEKGVTATASVYVTVREQPLPPALIFEQNTYQFDLVAGSEYVCDVNITNTDSNSHDLNWLSIVAPIDELLMWFELGDTVPPYTTFSAKLHVDAVNAEPGIYQTTARCLTEGDAERADDTILRFVISVNPNLPDLEVTSEDITFGVYPGSPGEPNTISAIIWNKGLTRAENVVVRFFDFEELIGSENIVSLDSGESDEVSITHTWGTSSFRFITVTADPDDSIKESKEDNNAGSKIYQVGEAPPMLGIIVVNCTQTTSGSTGIINGTVTYEILATGKSYPVKGGAVHVSYSGGEQDIVTDTEGKFRVNVPIPNYVTISVTDGPTTGLWFHVATDVGLDNIRLSHNGPDVVIDVDVHADSANTETVDNVPVTFYAYPSTGGKVKIADTNCIDHMPKGHSQIVSTTWLNVPQKVYRIEAELGPGYSDAKNWNNKAKTYLWWPPDAITVAIERPLDGETVRVSQGSLIRVSVTDSKDNIVLPEVLDSVVLDISGVNGRHVNVKPRFSWNSLSYDYYWWPPANAHWQATISVSAALGSLTASDSISVQVIDDRPPTFSIRSNPYWVLSGESVQITVDASEELMNDQLLSFEVKDSEGKVIHLTGEPQHVGGSATQWVWQTEVLDAAVALGRANITVYGVDLRGNPGSGCGHFSVTEVLQDFSVSSADIDFSNPNPAIGEDIIIEAMVEAAFDNTAPEFVPVRFYAHHVIEQGYQIGSPVYSDKIPADGSDIVSTPWQNAAEGVYIIEVVLEPDKNINDNAATRAIVVGEQPFSARFVPVLKRRVGRTTFEYECKVEIWNGSPVKIEDVELELAEEPDNVTPSDDRTVTFSSVEAGCSAISADTCKFTVDRSESIHISEISWLITFDVAVDGEPCTAQLTLLGVIVWDPPALAGDITGEGVVDISDLAELARQWLGEAGSPSADVGPWPGGDGKVDFIDFAELAGSWVGD